MAATAWESAAAAAVGLIPLEGVKVVEVEWHEDAIEAGKHKQIVLS